MLTNRRAHLDPEPETTLGAVSWPLLRAHYPLLSQRALPLTAAALWLIRDHC